MRILTIGTFDLLHFGHINLLNRCNELGAVIVGVNSDNFVQRFKHTPPTLTQDERMKMLSLLGYTVRLNDSPGKELIEQVDPDILVIGSDWARKDYLTQIDVTQDWLDQYNIMLLYIPYTEGISSSTIKARL